MKNGLILVFCLFLTLVFYGQSHSISGVVIDQKTGAPIPAANVTVQNLTRGVLNDFDANYSIEVSGGEVLKLCNIGYKE